MLLLLAVALLAAVTQGSTVKERFAANTIRFGWTFPSIVAENVAFEAFAQNDLMIMNHNANKSSSFTLGHNQFSVLTFEEFGRKYLNPAVLKESREESPEFISSESNSSFGDPSTRPSPPSSASSVDWVTRGAVTAVKTQGACGSDWAFAMVASFEGAYQIAGNKLTSFSEQSLVSCDIMDYGCHGGYVESSFNWTKQHGLPTEAVYPYSSGRSGETHACNTSVRAAAKLTNIVELTNELDILAAVAKGPVAIMMSVSVTFQIYQGGIYNDPGCSHGMFRMGIAIVGYGTDSHGTNYWKVKNAWSDQWGEKGYARIARDRGVCGIGRYGASYPTGLHPLPH
jgi:C1A family cysteine protease